jgi:hypothetical protein
VTMKRHGMIYGAYHFPTGKWYVGQTINTRYQRAQQHWWSRKNATDYLHMTLADDPDPMCWLALPLEVIPASDWQQPGPHHANWREAERNRLCKAANVRERFWVDKL